VDGAAPVLAWMSQSRTVRALYKPTLTKNDLSVILNARYSEMNHVQAAICGTSAAVVVRIRCVGCPGMFATGIEHRVKESSP